jgi:hypothetical protein
MKLEVNFKNFNSIKNVSIEKKIIKVLCFTIRKHAEVKNIEIARNLFVKKI